MSELASIDKYVLRETFEIAKGRAETAEALDARRLDLLRQANAWIDELMEQLEGVDMPLGLSDFLDKLAKELGDD